MEITLSLVIIVRTLIIFGIPAVFSLFSFIAILRMRKTNGSVIFRQRSFPAREFIFLFPFITSITESFEKGIYDAGIIFPNFSAKWHEVEGVINLEPTLRFIHSKKGAFDFKINPPNFEQVFEKVKYRTSEIDQKKDV